jgi:hypothetical protein
MTQELSPEAAKAIATVEKLLRLAGKNTNEHEAAAATAKAMGLLAAYNLDMSVIEQGGGEKAARTDEKMRGGLYHYQRNLWEAVAKLNFCLYWNQYVRDPNKKVRRKNRWTGASEVHTGGRTFQHRVVGRQVNVISTRNMAEYLQGTIERLTREKLHGDGSQFFTKWAMSFREGIADAVITRIDAERERVIEEENARIKAAEKRARRAGCRFADYVRRGQTPIVFHFGDHDPSGLDMTADNRRRLEMFAGVPVQVVRLALNWEQIERYRPPPNPAKETDSRFADYASKYGNESWELDALDPTLMQELISDSVLRLRDKLKWEEMVAQEVDDLRLMDQLMEDMDEKYEE